MKLKNNIAILQFIKYACVGVMNTIVTFIVIFLCKDLLEINEYVSNAIGYICGLINSFIWNKRWVFKSNKKAHTEAIKFAAGFLLCYGLQLFTVWFLNENTPVGDIELNIFGIYTLGGYGIATFIGNVAYTLANFIYNRLVTFK
ncbi:MAG: GtrA family protein [Muribaculaceae bacterium]